ncbi:MAG: ribonuclease HII [Candidatus Diapherotrites archaeon]|nr:ribonuclease HII [Candidatus Diapherotrites archaeon]
MLIAGVDEAGRGPAVGPMVLAVAAIAKKDEEKLIKLGVKDSKQLSPEERVRQHAVLRGMLSEFNTAHIPPNEIDSLRDRWSLNEIEAMRIGMLLNGLRKKPDVVFVDSPDPIAGDFGERIKRYLNFSTKIKAEHKADVNYPVVSAASIIAKVERDAVIKHLCVQYGEIGSGYPHDPKTIAFLCNWVKRHKALPEIARKSWSTSQGIQDTVFQKKLAKWAED